MERLKAGVGKNICLARSQDNMLIKWTGGGKHLLNKNWAWKDPGFLSSKTGPGLDCA